MSVSLFLPSLGEEVWEVDSQAEEQAEPGPGGGGEDEAGKGQRVHMYVQPGSFSKEQA